MPWQPTKTMKRRTERLEKDNGTDLRAQKVIGSIRTIDRHCAGPMKFVTASANYGESPEKSSPSVDVGIGIGDTKELSAARFRLVGVTSTQNVCVGAVIVAQPSPPQVVIVAGTNGSSRDEFRS